MKPPPQVRLALFTLHFYVEGLASAEDVVAAASLLDDDEKAHFITVGEMAFSGETAKKVQIVLEMLQTCQS